MIQPMNVNNMTRGATKELHDANKYKVNRSSYLFKVIKVSKIS